MHVGLILDTERLLHEGAMLNRLSVGLIDEGCTVTRIVPANVEQPQTGEPDSTAGITTRISVPMKVLPWLRQTRAEQLAEAMPRSTPDVFYAWGQATWPLAFDVGRRFDAAVAINIWSADLLRRLPRGRGASQVDAYITPSRAIAAALRELVDAPLVSCVPQGVAIPTRPTAVFADTQRPIAICIVGSGRDLLSYRALLGGMSRVIKQNSNVHLILELRGPQQHEIWRHARHLDLLANISAITDAAQFRSLLTRCDVMVLPERYGEIRSLTLDAMATGIPVIAANDPYNDILVDGETALLVPDPEPEPWASQLRKLLSSPEFAMKLGLAGRDYVQEHHNSATQVTALLETLRRTVHGESIGFSEQA